MGEWTTMLSAFFLPLLLVLQDVTPGQGELRLEGGGSNYGRLEFLYNGTWGTVCDDNFGIEDARVACRELSLDTFIINVYGEAAYGQGTGFIWLDEVDCTGSELTLESCGHDRIGSNDCSHSEDVGIVCGAITDGSFIGGIRLVNGESNYGLLEVSYNGVWGTVCDDDFDILAAKVACRQLGLDTLTVDYYISGQFGMGTGSIWLDEVDCFGSESTLDSCRHNSYGENDCSHSEDVGISCGISNVGGSSSSSSSGVGSWIGGAIFIIVVFVVAMMFRRRRLYMMHQRQNNTTIMHPPTTTTVHITANPNTPGTTPMPTYHPTAAPQQQPGEPRPYPAQTFTPAYPAAGGAPPPNPYPVQAYPPPTQYPAQPPLGAAPYPPQQPGAPPYPPQQPGAPPYPPQQPGAPPYPPQQPGAPPYPPQQPGAPPYPPQSTTGAAPYPPQQPGNLPTVYPPQSYNMPEGDLPPPPSYDDSVKQ